MSENLQLRRLTPRWSILRQHQGQNNYYTSEARFNVVPAGRRSGKSELAKRRLVRRAIARVLDNHPQFHNGRFFAAAPTRDQAKRLYWEDLKLLVPTKYLQTRPREADLIITLKNRVEIYVIGMDKPQRFEGSPWDGGILDEYGNMKQEAWMQNILPALADRQGWCDLIGVPEGRNHYYDRWREALACTDGSIRGHHWKSSEILPADEIERQKRMLDELSFRQEFEAEFVNFAGQCYYPFNDKDHVRPLYYDPLAPLIFCFDFNVSPGVAAIIQEQVFDGEFELVPEPHKGVVTLAMQAGAQPYPQTKYMRVPVVGTGVIGEVYIKQNSNTPAVVRKLLSLYGEHQGPIVCYGDSTGGSKGTAKVAGSDWDLIQNALYDHFGSERVYFEVPESNPTERARVNAVNTRLKTMDGVVRLRVDPSCEWIIKDFEGVRLLEGGAGEIDKKRDKMLSHLTDSIGYYIAKEYPIRESEVGALPLTGRF